jgi:PEP-CTERM/exosortase A-associated glycosyltransferase
VLDHSLPVASGYSYRSRSIVVHQRRAGLGPVVVTSPKHGASPAEREVIDGIPHYRTADAGARAVPFLRELLLMGKLARRIVEVARAERVGLIHAHSPLLDGLPAVWAARRLGLPAVYEVRTFWEDAAVCHGTFSEGSTRYRISRTLETMVMRRADRVVAICEGIRRDVCGRGIDPARVSVVPNGVGADWFDAAPVPAALVDRLELCGGPVFGYIGSFSAYEGLPFLIEAAADFLRPLPGARLVLAGGGRDEKIVATAARAAGPDVVWLGRLPQEQVRALYGALDVLVLPRRRTRLTELVTPLKPLEAMAMGKAVLASDVGGHAELITDGETGVLFPAERRDSLVALALRLGREGELRDRLGGRARRAAADRTWDRIVARYGPLYAGAAA